MVNEGLRDIRKNVGAYYVKGRRRLRDGLTADNTLSEIGGGIGVERENRILESARR